MGANKVKHIAVLSTLYYPDMGAPSACIDKYVRALKDDYQFHIITRTDCLNFEPSREYDVRYISNSRYRLILKCRDRIKNGKHVLWSKIVLSVINITKFIQTQFTFPSAQRWEVKQYAKQLELLHQEYGVDVVFAVSNTAFTQLATLAFKRSHPAVKWFAFFYDPYSENYIYYKYKLFKPLWGFLNKRKEQQIYDNADYVLLTVELFKFIPRAFNLEMNKAYQLQFPLNRLILDGQELKQRDTSSTCRMIYAGMFYKVIRNPEFLLDTISKVNGIQFDMFVGKGECEDIIKRYEGKNIHREQFVSRDTYIRMIGNEYDVLVNVGNVSTLQAPSKMLELLSAGRPILNFYFEKDTQYQMIEKYPLGLNIGFKEVGAVEKVERFCKEMKGRFIPFEDVKRLFPENVFETQVELLRRLIES